MVNRLIHKASRLADGRQAGLRGLAPRRGFWAQPPAAHRRADTGTAALAAILRETVEGFSPRLDDFRLAFLQGQVAQRGAAHFDKEQFERIRPLNKLLLGDAVEKLAANGPTTAGVEPRLLAFLAYLSALGLLTMKGMVENLEDPLAYSDEQLIEGFARVFAAAAGTPRSPGLPE